MKKLLIALLTLTTFNAAAEMHGDWNMADDNAYTGDISGENTYAQAFLTTNDQVSVGFTKWDAACKSEDTALKYSPLHIVANQPIMMQKQCIAEGVSLYAPKWEAGRDFIVKEFKKAQSVVVQTPDGKVKNEYSARGFTVAYRKLVVMAQVRATLRKDAL